MPSSKYSKKYKTGGAIHGGCGLNWDTQILITVTLVCALVIFYAIPSMSGEQTMFTVGDMDPKSYILAPSRALKYDTIVQIRDHGTGDLKTLRSQDFAPDRIVLARAKQIDDEDYRIKIIDSTLPVESMDTIPCGFDIADDVGFMSRTNCVTECHELDYGVTVCSS